jgi:hypothetical protein
MKTLLCLLPLLALSAFAAAPPPANDDFANRTSLVSGGSISTTGKNASATTQALEPTIVGDVVTRSVWWSWTAPFTGPVTISTAGSSFDTLLGVFTGTALGALTSIAENDDAGTGAFTSIVNFNAVSGIPYVILVGGLNGAGGKIALSITVGSGPCTYAVTPTSKSFSNTAGTGTETVSTQTGCTWSAASNDSFISITSGSTGSGSGTVSYSVSANTALTSRVGTMTIAGATVTINQAAAPACTYTLTPTSTNAPSDSVTNTVAMTAGTGCAWNATPNASWIAIASGASGTGSGTITYVLAANTNSNQRISTITAGGQTFTITQAGLVVCTFSISPSSGTFNSTGGSSNIVVSTITGCSWTASAPVTWVTFSSTNGTGNGTVTYTVTANTNTLSRNTTLTVAGQSYAVTQAGAACSYAITPTARTVSPTNGLSSVSVTAGTGCAWTSSANVTWISIVAGTSGTGNGTVTFTYGANLNTFSRSGQITIAGLTFTLFQQAAACIYSITPTAAHYLAGGGPGTIAVTAGTGCAWTAVSNDSFVTVDSGSPGSGNGTVGYTVTANATTTSRTGTITVAGSTFTVTQDGTVPCSYSIVPTSASFTSIGGTNSIAVSANAGCAWSVSSGSGFITFSPANGTGNGTVSYTVAANTSSLTRTGTIDIAGQTFTVTQTGVACTYAIAPTSASFTSTGGNGTVAVTATQGCNWTSSSDSSWLVVTNGATGTGNGSVGYSVAVNAGSTTRTGRLTIATKLLIVTQTGTACTFSISPTSAGVSDTGGGGSIAVTASDSACAWTAVSQAGWISVSPGSGVGNGSVSYVVAPTGLSTTRSGSILIAGQTFTVTQFGDVTGPTVVLTAPANGSTVSNVITMTATAVDSNVVARVEFYRGAGTLLGTVLTSPYNLPFQTTNLANGAYSFYARGFDTAGNQGSSGTNAVTVSNSVTSNTNQWAQGFGGTGSDFGNAVAVDASGNIWMAGAFQGTIVIGGNTLTNAGARDIVLAKFDSAGTLTWVKRFGSTGDELVRCMVVDASGNVYLGGSFTGQGNFGGASVTSAGGFDAFVAKYSSLGAFVWSKTYGSTANDVIYGIALDQAQTGVLATGLFSGTVAFTPVITYSSYLGSEDSVMLKYLASDGTPLWAKTFVNRDLDTGFAIFSDAGDNIILAGYFGYQINLGLGTLTSAGPNFLNDIYLAKFATTSGTNIPGNATWQMRYGGVNSDTLGGAGLDSSGNIVVAGTFKSTTDMGTGTLTGTGFDNDIFLAKYSGTTGLPIWTKAILCNPSAAAHSISFDATNNVVVGGFLNGTSNFGGQTITSAGSQDIFVAKYLGASPATLMWARGFGGTGTDDCNGVAVDGSNYPVITGYFMGTANFSGVTLTSAGSVDMHLVRLAP